MNLILCIDDSVGGYYHEVSTDRLIVRAFPLEGTIDVHKQDISLTPEQATDLAEMLEIAVRWIEDRDDHDEDEDYE